jgi:hypothetical protein
VRIWQEAVKKSPQLGAGSWIGSRAGAGEKLNKYGEAVGPLKVNRGGRGRCSASKLYLVYLLGNNDLEFSQKVNAPVWDWPQRLVKNWIRKFCLEIAQFF